MIEYFTNKSCAVDWDEAATIFQLAPLGKRRRDPDQLKRAFESSYAVVYAFHSGRLMGLGRALCDGEYQAAIYDIVLLPDYQNQGIGRGIVDRLRDQLPVENIILYSVPGREGFHEKCGFRRMRTAMAILNPVMSNPESGYFD